MSPFMESLDDVNDLLIVSGARWFVFIVISSDPNPRYIPCTLIFVYKVYNVYNSL